MTPFLHSVASDLCTRLGHDFSRTVIVFPNKRAGLFMNEYLLAQTQGEPMWAPRYMTVNELFRSFAPDLLVNDPIDTALRIVRLYRELTHHDVSVDWFYGWAERLLADFDDVDKNMVDADALFLNVEAWKSYDDTSFLSAEQVAQLRRFFSEFDPSKHSEVQDRYRELWDVLRDLYHALNDQLAAEGAAYEGALFRRVVERLAEGQVQLPDNVDRYVIVGFNVLDKVEHSLFEYLRDNGHAMFYWDYDVYYTKRHDECEAGLFMKQNIDDFGNELSAEHFDNLGQQKRIEMVSANTEAVQAQYVTPWLKANLTDDAKRTAIVLCNENTLQPVLHALPDDISELNITKGFPLSHTEVASVVERQLSEWERHRCARPVGDLLAELSERVDADGRAFAAHKALSASNFDYILQSEAYYLMHTILNRFVRILDRYADDEQMTLVTLRRLVRAVVRQSSVPFHGEPAVGLQVMGVLETRCLDFDHVIMLSVNDGMLPKKANDNSFIPYILRKELGLTTPERRTAVYAYYFYRLLQRAEHVTMTYSTATDGMASGEMSRFMTQLLLEWPWPVEHHSLNSPQTFTAERPQSIDKPADLLRRLRQKEVGGATYPALSPSAIKTYLDCPMRFYYRYVEHLKEPEDKSGEIKPKDFGDIFHRAAELVYMDVMKGGGRADPDWLRTKASDTNAMRNYISRAFVDKEVPYHVLEARVLEMYLAMLLRCDAAIPHLHIRGTELKVACLVDTVSVGQPVKICIDGVVDRLDHVVDPATSTGYLRILDYKTGSASRAKDNSIEQAKAASLDALFAPGGGKAYILQTFLYHRMLRHQALNDTALAAMLQDPVAPALFFIRFASDEDYDPRIQIGNKVVANIDDYTKEFDQLLDHLVSEILDLDLKFLPTEKEKECDKCPYRGICHRPVK